MRNRDGEHRRRTLIASAVTMAGVALVGVLPATSPGVSLPGVSDVLDRTTEVVAPVLSAEERRERERALQQRALQEPEDPMTQPPLHGTGPHGQGTVAVVDLAPNEDRPTGADPAGSDTGEEIVVGRARGEQNEDGTYHGHVTIAALFGNEILGVDTDPGEQEAGPLDPIQQGILDPLCDGSGEQICVSAVQADSSTDENGSTNRFSAAHATLGGSEGIDVGVAESNGNISDDGQCQTAHGDSTVADANVGGAAVADVAQSSTESRACKGQAPQQTNSSSVIGLGGTGVPLPAPGCADGTPDVITGVPVLAPIVCNADDVSTTQAAAPYGTREALAVYVLDGAVAKTVTAQSESRAQAPPPQCSDQSDNDGDGVIDAADPGCLSGPGGAYNPNDDNETDEPGNTQCSDTTDNDGDGVIDAADPGCLSGPGGTYNPDDDDETDNRDDDGDGDGGGRDEPACSDDRDNDGDGRTDRNDPGCLSGPGGTYNPNDRSEAGGPAAECADGVDNDGDGVRDEDDPGCLSGPGGTYNPSDDDESDSRRETGAASLPMTGADALIVLLAGVLMVGGGMDLRRRLRSGTPA